MGIFDFLTGKSSQPKFKGVQDPKWVRSPKGGFYRISYVDTSLASMKSGGVVVVWHGGVKPGWMCVKSTDKISSTIEQLANDKEVEAYEGRGGVFVTWSPIQGKVQKGVVKYLIKTMKPSLTPNEPAGKDDPIPVYHPGASVDDKPVSKAPGLA
ncbi:MAG: hypothetical protein OQJ97_11695 [Rhodospirillales bacterium]|nr:hypothetical protein [Rhodospirillales bacterium]